jgi:hypothetical protein
MGHHVVAVMLMGICCLDSGRNGTSRRCSNAVWEFAVFLSTGHRKLRRSEHEADHASTSVAAEFIGVA